MSVRPVRDVYAVGPGSGWRWLTHSRRFTATGAGTLVDEQVDWETGLPGVLGGLVDQVVLRRRVLRAMQSHLDAYAAAAARRALDVVQVVGAAIVDGDRVLVAQRSGVPTTAAGSSPAARSSRGSPTCRRWCASRGGARGRRSCRRRSSARCCWTASSAAARRAPRRCGSGGRGSRRPAGRARARGAPLGRGPTSSTTSTGSPPTAPSSPPSAPSSPASDRLSHQSAGTFCTESPGSVDDEPPAAGRMSHPRLMIARSSRSVRRFSCGRRGCGDPASVAVGSVPAAAPQRLRGSRP